MSDHTKTDTLIIPHERIRVVHRTREFVDVGSLVRDVVGDEPFVQLMPATGKSESPVDPPTIRRLVDAVVGQEAKRIRSKVQTDNNTAPGSEDSPETRMPDSGQDVDLAEEDIGAYFTLPEHPIEESPILESMRTVVAEQAEPLEPSEPLVLSDDSDKLFSSNRRRLFHPPEQRMPRPEVQHRPLSLVAWIVTGLVLCLLLYMGYIGGTFNSVLPAQYQYRSRPVEERINEERIRSQSSVVPLIPKHFNQSFFSISGDIHDCI